MREALAPFYYYPDMEQTEKKIEGTFEEYGAQPPDRRGIRSDKSDLYQMVMDNMTNAELREQERQGGVLESNGYSDVYRVTDYIHPFDGYNCQPVICFDEFRSSLKIKDMQ